MTNDTMVIFFTILIMLVVAYAQYREGLFTALTMLINVILAGLVAFNFWEPVANWLDDMWQNGALAGYEDALALGIIFALTLGILRLITNNLAETILDFSAMVNQIAGAVLGLLTGYLLAGFLICLMQTLPWHENFLDFQPRMGGDSGARSILPPDRLWLSLMRHAGAYSMAWKKDRAEAESRYDQFSTFDRDGTFELRYLRYRRYNDDRRPLKHSGEFNRAIGRER